MKEVITKNGKRVRIDDEDYELVSKYKWSTSGGGKSRRYATTAAKNEAGEWRTLYMHRLIMGVRKGQEIDHADGDPLNNQKANLRLCSHAENMLNRKLHKNSKTPYAGITFRTKSSGAVVWYARTFKQSPQLQGPYATPEEAARAHDEILVEVRGPFGRKNFPDTSPPQRTQDFYRSGLSPLEVELATELYRIDPTRCEAVFERAKNQKAA